MRKILFAVGAAVFLTLSTEANAQVVTFEDQAAFNCDGAGTGSSGGLNYSYGYNTCYYSPSDPADFPTPITSTVMANGFSPITFTAAGADFFNVSTLDLAFGPFRHGGMLSDTVLVAGNLFGGGALSTSFQIGYGFQTYGLNWNNLASLTFSAPVQSNEYVAFDNINYSLVSGVPEPSTWAMMLLGFGATGAALRRRRRSELAGPQLA